MEPARTLTVVEQPQPRLRLDDGLKPEPLVHRLTEIMQGVGDKFYDQWKDPLSLSLLEWGVEIISIDLIEAAANEEEFIEAARNQLIKLAYQIMVDVFVKTPLKNPVLVVETRWTCEKQFITECGHGKELTLLTHDFAIEVLKWATSLVEPQVENAVIKASPQFIPSRDAYRNYRILVTQRYAAHKLKEFVNEAQEESEFMQYFLELIKKRTKAQIDEVKEEVQKKEQKLEVLLTTEEQNSAREIAVLKTEAAELRGILVIVEAKVMELSTQISSQKNEISYLRNELWMHIQRVRALERQARKKKPWYKFW